MRDMFDEFMEELRRRQAELEGRDPNGPRKVGPEQDGHDDGDDEGDDEDPSSDRADADADAEDEGSDTEAAPPPRPRAASGGGSRPPSKPRSIRREGRPPSRRRIIAWTIGISAIVTILLLIGPGIDLITDAIWYRSVGYETVFWTRLGTQFWLFLGVLVAALVFLLGNLWIAGRTSPPAAVGARTGPSFFDRLADAARESQTSWDPTGRRGGRAPSIEFSSEDIPDLTPVATIALGALAIFIAIALASAASSAWETFLLWRNQVPFAPTGAAVNDPVFGRDIGFFLFELPFLRFVQSLFNGIVLGGLLIAGGRYLAGALRGGLSFTTPVRLHLGILGGLYLLSIAAGYQLDKLELVYSNTGVATGISYTDFNARFMALDVLTVIAALAAAFLVGGAFTRLVWPLGGVVVVWLGAAVILGVLYPEAVQRFVVQPNPYANEEPFIRFNISMTRLAYGLDTWEKRDYNGDQPLTAEDLQKEAATFQNARLWDYRPLGDTIDQLQTVRQYYDFVDVDTDRYDIQGDRRQVWISGRELDLPKSQITQNWLNTHIVYTHGIGLVMVPVNEVQGQGQPELWIKDLPPVSSSGAPTVDQPRIYFGEAATDYIITGARQAEFDYPSGFGGDTSTGEAGTDYRWTGESGIHLDTTLSRLLFAARFRDLNLLISDQITNESQLLFHRTISDRLPRIAPFLKYDKDPYLVVLDGRLVYVQDAYTTSDKFPNAQPFSPSSLTTTNLGDESFDYIRNSVKVVVDAYTGKTTFYVADPDDPIIRAYEGVFPGMFHPLSEMETGLRQHLRTPEEQFNVQTLMFGRYHVTNPQTFFQNDDIWAIPTGQTSEATLPTEAYYVIMRAPGESNTEFLLLQPMVPRSRPNMIAWVAARMDGDNYGQVRYYQFPSNTTVFGPTQVEALIDQDPTISSQLTLWSQAGSTVIRGNLLVVPVQDSIVYLQPVYLQSTGSSFPEFQKIVVATPTTVVWADTLEEALRQVITAGGPGPSPSPGPTPSPGGSPTPRPSATPVPTPPSGDIQALIAYANQHFELAQQALRAGDFATYGAEMKLVEQALTELSQLAGTPVPSILPSPSLGPTPSPSVAPSASPTP